MTEVSIVIPTFNRRGFVSRAVRSVLEQSVLDLEVIVVDDGSTDGTEIDLRRIDDCRLRVLSICKRQGAAVARNFGIRAASAPLVAFLDSDDEWLPKKLEEQISSMRSDHREKLVSYCQVTKTDGFHKRVRPSQGISPGESVSNYLFAEKGLMQTSTLLLPTFLARDIWFDEDLVRHQDYDFCLRLEANGAKFRFVDKALVLWNVDTRLDRLSSTHDSINSLHWFERWRPSISIPVQSAFIKRFVEPHRESGMCPVRPVSGAAIKYISNWLQSVPLRADKTPLNAIIEAGASKGCLVSYDLTTAKVASVHPGTEHLVIEYDSAENVPVALRFWAPTQTWTKCLSDQDIEDELTFLKFLNGAKLCVPGVRRGKFGKDWQTLKILDRSVRVSCLDFIVGKSKSGFSQKDASEVGRLLCRLHEISKEFEFPNRRSERPPLSAMAILRSVRVLTGIYALPKRYDVYLDRLQDSMDSLVPQLADNNRCFDQPIHGDINPKNVLWSGEKIVGLIDFGDCRFSSPMDDLAYAATLGLEHFQEDSVDNVCRGMLSGYLDEGGSLLSDYVLQFRSAALMRYASILIRISRRGALYRKPLEAFEDNWRLLNSTIIEFIDPKVAQKIKMDDYVGLFNH